MVFLLAIMLAVDFAISLMAANLFSSIAATILFSVAAIAMFMADTIAIWLLLPFILLQFATLVSLNFIEGGSYIIEMGQLGYASTAAVTYCLYALLLLCVTLVSRGTIQVWYRQVRPKRVGGTRAGIVTVSPVFHYAFLAIALMCVLYLLLAGLRTGFPLLTHTDRFAYRRLYADAITINILDFKVIPPLGLGIAVLVAPSRWLRLMYNLCFVAFVIESLLFGDKFFIISFTVIAFLAPRIVQDPAVLKRRLLSFVPIMVVAFCAMSATTYFIYSDYGSRSLDDTMKRVGDRISGQGELWFMATNDDPSAIGFDRKAVAGNIESIFQKNPADYLFAHNLGPNYFPRKYSPAPMYRAFVHNNGSVTPTMAFEAYGLVLFGYIGLVVQMIISGVFLALLLLYVEGAIRHGNPFLTLIPAFLLIGAAKLFAQGTLYTVVSLPSFKILSAFLVLEVIVRLMELGLNRRQSTGSRPGVRVSSLRMAEMNALSLRTLKTPRLGSSER